jgi:SAM-dependent methyltransferase
VKRAEVQKLYDDDYAASYDEKFLRSPIAAADADYEVELLRSLLVDGLPWLDVACGTGYFLRQFQQVERAGIDLSPSMISLARVGNEGVEFRQQDYLTPIPGWTDGFGLVSCMWYAYGYVDTLDELSALVQNLAAWTAPEGNCFVPLADPRLLSQTELPGRIDTGWGGPIDVVGIIWNWEDENGTRRHEHMLAPHLDWMVGQFRAFFADVEVVYYAEARPGIPPRPALIASSKLRDHPQRAPR